MNRATFFSLFVGICVAIIVIFLTSPVSGGQDTVRITIDTKTLTLKVIQGNRETLVFTNIAIGRYGTTTDKRKGDNKTPLGHFTVAWITRNTSFHRFFGFRYPSKELVDRTFQAGHLDQKTWKKFHQVFASGGLPPQDTVLGGNLGIHGIGAGDINIHEQYNWTNGCVALTNDQIDRLAAWVRIGTPVDIY